MTVTLTALELAAAMRIGDGETPLVEPQASQIARLLASSSAIVVRYAPNAPDSVHNEAVVRHASYLFDSPAGASTRTASAMRDSGAMDLLSSYRVIGAVKVETDDEQADSEPSHRRLPSAEGQPDGKVAKTRNEQWVIGDDTGGMDGVANSVDLSVSGQDLTVTIGRSEDLDDLTDTVTLPDAGDTLPEYSQSDTEVLHSRAGNLYWEGINEVPDTPGTTSGVGHVLTVTGENDKDYAFQTPDKGRELPEYPAEGSRNNKIAKFDGDVLGWEEDGGSGAVMAGRKLELTPTSTRVATLPSDYNTYDLVLLTWSEAELTIDVRALEGAATLTLRSGGQTTVAWNRTARTLTLNRNMIIAVTLLNAGGEGSAGSVDTTARTKADSAQSAAEAASAQAAAAQLDTNTVIKIGPAFRVGETTQRNLYLSIQHDLNAYSDANILSVAVQGQTPILQEYQPNTLQADYTIGITSTQMNNIATAGHFVEGNYILVDVRLTQGRGGSVEFFRNVYVPVVAAGAALSDSQIGDKAFSNPPNDLTNNEKTAVRTAIGAGTSTVTLVEYANETAAKAATVGSNVIQWWPA